MTEPAEKGGGFGALALKVVLSLGLAAGMIFLASRLVDVEKFKKSLEAMNPAALIGPVIATLFAQSLRGVRWWRIVRPVRALSLPRVAPTAYVGFMAINVLPLRMGEVVRPLLLRARDGVPFSSGLATCVAERVVDALAVFAMLFIGILVVPATVIHIGTHDLDLRVALKLLLVIFVPAAIFLAALVVLRQRLVDLVTRVLSPVSATLAKIAARILGTFVEGLEAFQTPARFAEVAILTLLVWAGNATAMYLGFQLFAIPLGPVAAVAVLGVTMAGITIPGGIGMSGNFQLFCVAALALFSIESSAALAYSVVMNVVFFTVAVAMGIVALPFAQVSLKSLLRAPETAPR